MPGLPDTYIGPDTRIARILQADEKSLEALVQVAPALERLRQPLVRRMLAGRTSLSQAARVAGVSLNDLYQALEPLGFHQNPEANEGSRTEEPDPKAGASDIEAFLSGAACHPLDVRPDLQQGKDPLKRILETLEGLASDTVLELISDFEPVPLIQLLRRKGYTSLSCRIQQDLYHTYFRRDAGTKDSKEALSNVRSEPGDFDAWADRFAGRIVRLDVHSLPMPQPMIRILQELESLPEDQALQVTHRKVPELLFPELRSRSLGWVYRIISTDHVELLIFHDSNQHEGVSAS